MSAPLRIKAVPETVGEVSDSFHGLIYASNQFDSVITRLKIIAPTSEVVLLTGETGTGKELIARAVHKESHRRGHPFIAFNCSALSRELIESRLFGYRKGAFTGAHADQPGVIRAAAGGSVFLDEIGDLTLEAQGALLRFLQSREIQPVGATRPVTVDVRAIAATNCDLRAQVEAGRFRKDLYYRLNVLVQTTVVNAKAMTVIARFRREPGALSMFFVREFFPGMFPPRRRSFER